MAAPDAPICWLPETGVTLIDAVSSPSVGERFADLTLADVACIPHAIISTDGRELLVVRATDRFVILRLRGCRATTRSVNLTLLVNGLSDPPGVAAVLRKLADLAAVTSRYPLRTRRQLLMRDALIALDAYTVVTSYRKLAVLVVGPRRAAADWQCESRSLKERMRRVVRKGRLLSRGGYRTLLQRRSPLRKG